MNPSIREQLEALGFKASVPLPVKRKPKVTVQMIVSSNIVLDDGMTLLRRASGDPLEDMLRMRPRQDPRYRRYKLDTPAVSFVHMADNNHQRVELGVDAALWLL